MEYNLNYFWWFIDWLNFNKQQKLGFYQIIQVYQVYIFLIKPFDKISSWYLRGWHFNFKGEEGCLFTQKLSFTKNKNHIFFTWKTSNFSLNLTPKYFTENCKVIVFLFFFLHLSGQDIFFHKIWENMVIKKT